MQLSSYPFWFCVIFMSIQGNRSIMFVGMRSYSLSLSHTHTHAHKHTGIARDWLTNIGDTHSTYSTIFGIVLPLSPLVIPCVTFTSARVSLAWSMHIINGLGFVYGILCLIEYVVGVFVCFSVFSCSLVLVCVVCIVFSSSCLTLVICAVHFHCKS